MAYVVEARQVFDFPVLSFEVTEHHAMQAICSCGQVHAAEFPGGVNASVQYGARAQAAMVHLNQNHAVPVQRTAALMKDFFDLSVSQATIVKAGAQNYCVVRSSCATMHKQGANVFESLAVAFKGTPPQPCLG